MVRRLKDKKYGILLFIVVAVFLLYKSVSINQVLSEVFAAGGTYHSSNEAQGMVAMGEILEGDMLRQPMYLEYGAKAVGVRFGTYQRENNANYLITILDMDGNILGRREVQASRIADNQMVYVNLYGRVDIEKEYSLTVEGHGATPGDAVTCYGVGVTEGHAGLEWNGEGNGMKLVTDILYQGTFPFTGYLTALTLFLLFVYFLLPEVKMIACNLWKAAWQFLRTYHKVVLLGCIFTGLAGMALLLLSPLKKQRVLEGSIPEENVVIMEYSSKWSQQLIAMEAFDGIEVKIGTYMESYREGSLVIVIQNIGNPRQRVERRILADQIRDNGYLHVGVGRLEPGTYLVELWTEDFGGQKLALYCTGGGDSLIIRMTEEKRQYAVSGILGFGLFAFAAGMLYFCVSVEIRRERKGIVVAASLSILAGVCINTYVNYQGVSLPALAKNLGLAGAGEETVIDGDEIAGMTERTVRYGYNGVVKAIFDQIHVRSYGRRVDSITLYFADTGNESITNIVHVYMDMGSRFSEVANYEYSYKGQDRICIPICELQGAENIILDFSRYDSGSGLISGIDHEWYSLEKISFNEETIRLDVSSWAFLAGVLGVWLIYFWQYFKMEERVRGIEGRKKDLESKAFVVASLLFGTLMIVLLPATQVPDEGTHISRTFASIGAGEAGRETIAVISEAEKGVANHGGVRVDRRLYLEKLRQHLSEYPSSFSINLSALKYPGAALGALLGLLFCLSVGGIIFMSKFLALLLYTAVGAQAIRVAPVKKKLFMAVLLLPIAMQQAASYSYDSFNNAVAILAIAYLLYLALEKKKVVPLDILKLAGMLFILLYIKKLYVMCGLLVLLIPYCKLPVVSQFLSKASAVLDRKWKKACAAVLTVGIVGIIGVVGIQIVSKAIGIEGMLQSFLSVFCYPKELLLLLGKTVVSQFNYWLKWFSASFGWLDGTTAGWITWLVFAELFIAALSTEGEECNVVRRRDYLICIGVFLVMSVLIILSMFKWTQQLYPVVGGIKNQILLFMEIEGVQGRYFLPIIVLPFLFPVFGRVERAVCQMPLRLCLIAGWLVMVTYTAATLLERYWI